MTTQIIPARPSSLPKLSSNERGLFESGTQTDMVTQKLAEPPVYYTVFDLIQEMDYRLERGEHYRIAGWYCRTLDEVTRAILTGELLEPEEVA